VILREGVKRKISEKNKIKKCCPNPQILRVSFYFKFSENVEIKTTSIQVNQLEKLIIININKLTLEIFNVNQIFE
jgi:hypothetical protein